MNDQKIITRITVSRDGNADCKTLSEAFAAVSDVRRAGLFHPLTVTVLDAVTAFEQPIAVSPADAPYFRDVTIEGKNADCLLSGGKRITGWKSDTFAGHACLSADLAGFSVDFSDLYVNGRPAAPTRFPKEGFLRPVDVDDHGKELVTHCPGFSLKKEDLPLSEASVRGSVVSFTHYWIDEHSPVKDYDPATGHVTLRYKSTFAMDPGAQEDSKCDVWFENVSETFGDKGVFFLDRNAKKLYYTPKPGETADNIEAYVPIVDRLFTFTGNEENLIRGIRFRRLKMAYTKSDYAAHVTETVNGKEVTNDLASDIQGCCGMHGAVNFSFATDCEMRGVDMFCIGSHGVVLVPGCSYIRLDRVTVKNSCGGGIRADGGGISSPLVTRTHDITVENCEFSNLGEKHLASIGVLLQNAHHCTVRHNDIHSLYYSGISVGWVWGYADSVTCGNLIEKNHIYDLGRGRLSDMGGIYLLGKQPGTVVRENLIHDVVCKKYGGWALYTDEGSSYITLERNVCYDRHENCLHQHYGRENVVRGNIFANAKQAAIRMTREEDHIGLLLENNVLILKKGTKGFFHFHIVPPILESGVNVVWKEDLTDTAPFDGIAECDVDRKAIVRDPGITSFGKRVYALPEGFSDFPFEPIDLSDVGPRSD